MEIKQSLNEDDAASFPLKRMLTASCYIIYYFFGFDKNFMVVIFF